MQNSVQWLRYCKCFLALTFSCRQTSGTALCCSESLKRFKSEKGTSSLQTCKVHCNLLLFVTTEEIMAVNSMWFAGLLYNYAFSSFLRSLFASVWTSLNLLSLKLIQKHFKTVLFTGTNQNYNWEQWCWWYWMLWFWWGWKTGANCEKKTRAVSSCLLQCKLRLSYHRDNLLLMFKIGRSKFSRSWQFLDILEFRYLEWFWVALEKFDCTLKCGLEQFEFR